MASKSKKRRRVLGASCILAALIIAGSSFAWFTSKDEVTNRLSASSDYGVKVVESFAPPKNWIPGEEVNKDTYAVNTGSIPAYVRSDVSGVLSLTTEKPVEIKYGTGEEAGVAKNFVVYEDTDSNPATPDVAVDKAFTTGTNFASFLTLDEDEVFSKEAGSYLAYKPAASKYELGKQVVIYPSNAATTKTVYRPLADDTTYGGTKYVADQEISATEYATIPSANQSSFTAIYTNAEAAGSYAANSEITATEYDGISDAIVKAAFTLKNYKCTTPVTVGASTISTGATIEADEWNGLDATDKALFKAEEVSTDKPVYVAKEDVTVDSVTYVAGKQIPAEKYDALTDSDADKAAKAKIAVVTQSASKTDFTPDAEGLYVFRRNVIVNNNATEQFEYDGYYFKDGRYYKITDLEVTQDDSLDPNEKKEELDVAGDGNDKDGQLADAKAKFLVDDTTIYYQPKSFVYDADNNRLVATYLTDANGKYQAYQNAADALDRAEHTLAETRTALDRALNDAAASDANVAFYANRMAQIQAEIDRVKARIAELYATDPDAANADDGTIIDNLNDEVDRLSHATDPKGVIDTAKEAAQTKFDELYGAGAATVTFDEDGNNTTSYTKPTTADTANDNSLWKAYLTAKEAVETARQSENYGHDLFTAYVNELTNAYGTEFTNAGFTDLTKVTYEDVLNTLSYAQLTNTNKVNFDHIEQNAGGPLHNINRLTANLVKAKDDYDKKLAEYNSQVTSVKTNTQRLGKNGTKTTTVAPAAGCNEEIVGGTTIKYNKVTVSDESGVKGDLARANAELDTLKSKLTALNTAYDTAAEAAANAERVDPNDSNSADTSETATAAWTAYQVASKAYDDALNAYNAAKKDYENGNPLKIYINLSENVVTEAAGLADRWQLLPVNPLSDGFTADGRVVGEDGVAGDNIADTAVFYYTSILGAGETSSKLVDSVTLDAGTTQGMYKAFDYDLSVALKSAQITYTGADNATISTIPANTEFGARYVDGLSDVKGTINGANATLTNDKSLDTAVNWTVDDNPAN